MVGHSSWTFFWSTPETTNNFGPTKTSNLSRQTITPLPLLNCSRWFPNIVFMTYMTNVWTIILPSKHVHILSPPPHSTPCSRYPTTLNIDIHPIYLHTGGACQRVHRLRVFLDTSEHRAVHDPDGDVPHRCNPQQEVYVKVTIV